LVRQSLGPPNPGVVVRRYFRENPPLSETEGRERQSPGYASTANAQLAETDRTRCVWRMDAITASDFCRRSLNGK